MKKLAGLIIFILGIQFSYGQNGDFIETNGVKIFYETHGKGEPLLLVHGFTISGKAWHPWVEDLSKDYLLIIPDLRGHGNSTNPSQKFTHRLSAEDMYGLMDALDIERFKAMGQSSGAMTLLHMATMDTTRISDLILVSGTSYFPPQHKKGLEDFNYEDFKSWHKDKIHLKSDEQITMIYKQFKKFPETFDDMNFTTPYLAQIKCPTLIIHGDRDQFFPVDIPVEQFKSIPNSYLWIVPNEGHVPIGIYDRNSIWSDVLHLVIKDFFAGNWEKK